MALVGACLLGWLVSRLGAVPDPVHDGRKASAWFSRLLRYGTPPRTEDDELHCLEARRALLLLGTNAVPFLVDQALHPGSDSPIRRGLRRLGQVSDVQLVHPGRFPTPYRRALEARKLLESIRPPASLVLSRIRTTTDATTSKQSEALQLLATCPDAGPHLLPFVSALPERRLPDDRLVQALGMVRPPPPESLAFALETLPRANPGSLPYATLFAAFGPTAKPALGWLESSLTNAPGNAQFRIWTAIALLEIEPDHPAASALLTSIPRAQPFDALNNFQSADALALWHALSRWRHPLRSPVTRTVVEQLARQEVEGWAHRAISLQAARILETIDPPLAATLYLPQLTPTNPPPVRLHAAGSLLRVLPTSEPALRVLREYLDRYDYPALLAAEQLGEANPEFTDALETLRQAATNAHLPSARARARASLIRIEIRALEAAARSAP